MARRKEFDKEEVLEKAMDTFWRFGYEGTSMQSLVKNMGINRSSLYETFGDKHSLFEAAITHYEQTRVKGMVTCLQEIGASKPAIAKVFNDLIEQSVGDKDRRGCFLTNTAIELCPHDPQIAEKIAVDMKIVERAFYKVLVNAQKQGEIAPTKDLSEIAQYLTSSFQGIRVMAKVNQEPDFLKNIVKVTLSVLN
ncbi:regulatory protein TetR [[Leptolyngbya] sp. PCC 7376]|uniref:TetR/AcrR family transcriptional regulator n=1 Tax=[Leptolyngbya] sp. PCC 7376 TaxID=111781 RepID=UPI00029F141A|nr:TetR/AcrR family transcriptional regulator [[Leptolyngbya] sp. PCC 7376]AFY37898.1 regulatory protein TetR [[Leptolyngbya] sp. PCC 7376]